LTWFAFSSILEAKERRMNSASHPNLFLAPAGWAHSDWQRAVFHGEPRRHPLELLARYVDACEVSQTFDAPLRPEVARLWLRKTESNPRFRFVALLGHTFSYERLLDADAIAAWKHGVWPLHKAGRLGAVVLQFPWAFRFTTENREFLIRLRRAFHEFPLVAELRHASWQYEEALGTLIDYRIGYVNFDGPECFRLAAPASILTSGVACVRLHGRTGAAAFQGFDAAAARPPYLYTTEQLAGWAPRIERLAGHASATFVLASNAAGGRSLLNLLQLGRLLGRDGVMAPAGLLRLYPRELAEFRSARPVQTALLASQAERAVA
jgi:uncharacterized protein YecE (DUF72 family)